MTVLPAYLNLFPPPALKPNPTDAVTDKSVRLVIPPASAPMTRNEMREAWSQEIAGKVNHYSPTADIT